MRIKAIIMAGGSGERFWPWSQGDLSEAVSSIDWGENDVRSNGRSFEALHVGS